MKKPLVIVLSIIGILLLIGIGIFIYFKVTYLSKDEVREIVISDVGEKDGISFTSIDLDIEENFYEVEFYYDNIEYEYKIDAKNGRIIYNNFKVTNQNSTNTNQSNNTSNQSNNVTNNNQSESTNNVVSEITLDEAKEIAVKANNLNQANVTFTELKTDYNHGRKIYEIEYYHNHQEYSYEIDAATGEIISYEKDHR